MLGVILTRSSRTQICICIWLSISINQGELFASILMAACGGWGVYFSTTTQNIS